MNSARYPTSRGSVPHRDPIDAAVALQAIAGDVPSVTLPRSEVVDKPVVDVFVAAGLQNSKGAARRLIQNGGVRRVSAGHCSIS